MPESLGSLRGLVSRYLRPLAPQVTVLATLLFLSIGLQLAQPQVMRLFIDAATTGAAPVVLRDAAILFIGLAVVQQGAAVLATYFSERVGWTATNALREDLMLHCLRLDLAFHKARTPGELIERIDGDVTALANFFSQFIVQLAGNALLFLAITVVLWLEDWVAGMTLLMLGGGTLFLMFRLRAVTVPHWRESREASAGLFGYIEERLGGTEDVRSSGAEPYVVSRLYPHLRRRVHSIVRARIIGAAQWTVPNFLFTVWNVAILVYVAWLYRSDGITIGTAFLVMNYVGIAFRPIRMISQQMEEFQKASAGIIRVRDLIAERSQLVQGRPELTLPSGALSVEFDGVTFAYDDGATADDGRSMTAEKQSSETVLHDVSFALRSGETLGLLGRTGSGKTTITRLLFRFYDPTEGVIRLGGLDTAQLIPAAIRDRIGLVTQDVQLFRATVRENVTLFDETVEDARIHEAFRELGLAPWFESLPDGLDTVLGAGGGGLSAGEAQLLAFTRVFLRDPGLVILDEASSRLDPATERLIDRAVARLLEGRTGIIIAHRLSTISRVDTVLILEHGRIVEHGPRAQLAQDTSSRLAALLKAGLDTPNTSDTVLAPAEILA
jgi:ATP-binding cassette, subfamily B, bacterial